MQGENLDDFNRVSFVSQLTHQNILATKEKLFPEKEGGENKCYIAFYQNSISSNLLEQEDGLDQIISNFRSKNDQDKISIILCDGVLDQSNEYEQITDGTHWTTLHLRKTNDQKIVAYYTDSLQGSSIKVPQEISSKLKKHEIDQINSIDCTVQDTNKCGDHSVFNALAFYEMSQDQLNSKKIIDTLDIPVADYNKKQSMNVREFVESNRQDLMKTFNISTKEEKTKIENLQDIQELKSILKYYDTQRNQDNIELIDQVLKQNQEIIRDFVKNIQSRLGHEINPTTEKFLKYLNSSLVIENTGKFMPLLKEISRDASIIKDLKFQSKFRNTLLDLTEFKYKRLHFSNSNYKNLEKLDFKELEDKILQNKKLSISTKEVEALRVQQSKIEKLFGIDKIRNYERYLSEYLSKTKVGKLFTNLKTRATSFADSLFDSNRKEIKARKEIEQRYKNMPDDLKTVKISTGLDSHTLSEIKNVAKNFSSKSIEGIAINKISNVFCKKNENQLR